MYIIDHANFILLFSFLPLMGVLIQRVVPKKMIQYAIYTCIIFFLPIFTGYSYVIDNAYGIIVYVILMCGYGLFITSIHNKLKTAIIHSAMVFPVCLVVSFGGKMFGSRTVEEEWHYRNYKIVYLRDQGFSGGPLMTYQLSKFGSVPIFIKHVDTKVDNDTTGSCWVKFADTRFNFNKCNRELSFIEKK